MPDKSKNLTPSRKAYSKTARYLATCYFCKETIRYTANAADKNRMFLKHALLLYAYFTFTQSAVSRDKTQSHLRFGRACAPSGAVLSPTLRIGAA